MIAKRGPRFMLVDQTVLPSLTIRGAASIFPKVTRAATTRRRRGGAQLCFPVGFVHIFGPRVSFSLAFFIALVAHFTLSKYWTFRDGSAEWGRQIWQYLVVALISYFIQLAVFQSALSFLGLRVFGANAMAIVVGTIVGFLLMHSWVFSSNQVPRSPHFPRRERPNATTSRLDPPA